ncbi:hypothetical protein [Spirosoma fluviale]|nr:hypothetical protein [Spirosoma fluviale]
MYRPDEYKLNQLLTTVTPMALRVLFFALATVSPDGSVELRPVAMTRQFQTDASFIGRAVRELVKYKMLARKNRFEFWLSPAIASPITFQVPQR